MSLIEDNYNRSAIAMHVQVTYKLSLMLYDIKPLVSDRSFHVFISLLHAFFFLSAFLLVTILHQAICQLHFLDVIKER